jgi:hypothetical protein
LGSDVAEQCGDRCKNKKYGKKNLGGTTGWQLMKFVTPACNCERWRQQMTAS